MESNAEEDRYSDDEHQRPPSSYGSMRSSVEMETEEDGPEENQCDQEVAAVLNRPAPVLPQPAEGVRLHRPASPETQYTMTTMQTKPPGALVIETGSDMDRNSDIEEEEEDECYITNSPEPPEPIEQGEGVEVDVQGQPGTLHPEQTIAHIFRNIQKTLTDLQKEDLYKFRLNFNFGQDESTSSLRELFAGDLLDFVDRIIEKFGLEHALSLTLSCLQNISKHKEATELQASCKKALMRFSLRGSILRQHQYYPEGVTHPGKRTILDDVYVEPEIYRCSCGGLNSYHEFRNPHQMVHSPPPDSAVSLKNMFRLQKADGLPVRTVVTSGVPGSGFSISVAKYCYDWAEERCNRDLQYVITLPFYSLWSLREQNLSTSKEMSIMDVIEHHHSLCKTKTYLDEEDCKFLIILDGFDCYNTPLDWKNTPIIKESNAPAKVLDHLVVNLIRGNLLPNARLWILGRGAAVSRIPSEYIDAFTEIHGFNNEMQDDFLRKRCKNDELANKMIQRINQLSTLRSLTVNPIICWMMKRYLAYNYKNEPNYGRLPPKLTNFFVHILVFQINRRLETYFDQADAYRRWSKEDQKFVGSLARMAFKMFERSISEFGEEDLKEYKLDVIDVTVFSGLCIELPPASTGKRRFSFFHATFLDFMAAVHVRYVFRWETKNALAQGLKSLEKTKMVDIVQSAINLYFKSPPGHYDMFLRFLFGMFNPDPLKKLEGHLHNHRWTDGNFDWNSEMWDLKRKTMLTCPPERKELLEECFREFSQNDD